MLVKNHLKFLKIKCLARFLSCEPVRKVTFSFLDWFFVWFYFVLSVAHTPRTSFFSWFARLTETGQMLLPHDTATFLKISRHRSRSSFFFHRRLLPLAAPSTDTHKTPSDYFDPYWPTFKSFNSILINLKITNELNLNFVKVFFFVEKAHSLSLGVWIKIK